MTKVVSNQFVEANLNPYHKSLSIELLSCINNFSLEQIHKILIWCQEHPEIQAVVLNLSKKIPNKIASYDKSQLEDLNQRIQKISLLMLNLTQTVVADYGSSLNHLDLELGLAADIRISTEKTVLNFDYLKNGLIPGAGGICLLERILSPCFVSNWLFGNKVITQDKLLDIGFLYECYVEENRVDYTNHLMAHLNSLPPVQRVQAKRSLWEKWSGDWEEMLAQELLIFKASLMTNDHFEAQKDKPNFCQIKDLKALLMPMDEMQ